MANEQHETPPPRQPNSPNDWSELARKRYENDRRLEGTFSKIYEKYSRDFTNVGDEIDLETGEVVVDNGHLMHMKDERDVGNDQAHRFVRAFTANLLYEEPIVISDDDTQSESGWRTEESDCSTSSADELGDAYDGDEEGMDDHTEEDVDGLEKDSDFRNQIVNLTTKYLKSSLHLSNTAQRSSSNKRKAPRYSSDGGATRRQKLSNERRLDKSTGNGMESNRPSGHQQLFDERDVSELGQAIAKQVADFVDQRLHRSEHSGNLLSASAQKSAHRRERDDANLDQNFTQGPHANKKRKLISPQANKLAQQTQPTPERRSLWASSKPLTPAAEVRRVHAISKSRMAHMELSNQENDQEIPIDPTIIRESDELFRQNEQTHGTPNVEALNENVPLTERRTLGAEASYDSDTSIKDEPDYHSDLDGVDRADAYHEPQNSIEGGEAGGGAEYSANTKRRLEQSETPDTSTWRWTEEQDNLLLRLKNVENKDWPEIVQHFPSRSYRTIQQRYYNLMKPAREDNRLRQELERQRALNKKLMLENAAHRGIPPEDSVHEQQMQEHDDRDSPSSYLSANENLDDHNVIDPSLQVNSSMQAEGTVHIKTATESQEQGKGGEQPGNLSNHNVYPDPQDTNIDPLLLSWCTGQPQNQGDETRSAMVVEDELLEGSMENEAVSQDRNELDESQWETDVPLDQVSGEPKNREDSGPPPSIAKTKWPGQVNPLNNCRPDMRVGDAEHFKKWNSEDDRRLLELRYFQRHKWPDVAKHFPRRTYRSLQQRYYSLHKPDVYLGEDGSWKIKENSHDEDNGKPERWDKEDDELILHLRETERLPWEEIARKITNRSEISIQRRYLDLTSTTPTNQERVGRNPEENLAGSVGSAGESLRNEMRVQGWTNIELEQLRHWKEVAHMCWERIADKFPGRTTKNIRQRYYLLRDTPRIRDGDYLLPEDRADGNSLRPNKREQMSHQRAWESDEEWDLHRMRDVERKSWAEIREHFPYRTLGAVQLRYYTVARDLDKKAEQDQPTNEHRRVTFGPGNGSNTDATPQGSNEQPVITDETSSRVQPGTVLAPESSPSLADTANAMPPVSDEQQSYRRTRRNYNARRSVGRPAKKPREPPEPYMDQPWRPTPITPSSNNPHTNQPWMPTMMMQPLFPPKKSTDELLRAIVSKQAPVTPRQTPNQAWNPSSNREFSPIRRPVQHDSRSPSVIGASSATASPGLDQGEGHSAVEEAPITAKSSQNQLLDHAANKESSVSTNLSPLQPTFSEQLRNAAMSPDTIESFSDSRASSHSPESRARARSEKKICYKGSLCGDPASSALDDSGSEDELAT
ncbi:hypothetical protein EV356DRAFT_532830 [Viridothelium virens]|uniref:Myb-like domain-containing protein n=1 Tax=Viridothelium virens TaxID=1048519 RepID=A0A6A6H9M6_VIRVR|nr:hypothetical protein EV356DRAFT_532830 [Viridothelium virens]